MIREAGNMKGNRYYGVRVEGAKCGVGFGSALAIAICYTANHSILWAIIHGILGWLYVIYFACFGHNRLVVGSTVSRSVVRNLQ
jgi:hypothetical protein